MSMDIDVYQDEGCAEVLVNGELLVEVDAPGIGPVRARVHEVHRDDDSTSDWKWSQHHFEEDDDD